MLLQQTFVAAIDQSRIAAAQASPRRRGWRCWLYRWRKSRSSPSAPETPSTRARPYQSAENASEVTLVGESTRQSDLREFLFRTLQKRSSLIHAPMQEPLMRRHAD